jgi:DNA mismatch repair protein MutS2
VSVANLVGLAEAGDPAPPRPPATVSRTIQAGSSRSFEEEETTVDVRGRAADEALDRVVAALDRATVTGAPFLRIIHGQGTGRLKTALRQYLKESPYVVDFRAGDRAEGGDGVTIVRLR